MGMVQWFGQICTTYISYIRTHEHTHTEYLIHVLHDLSAYWYTCISFFG